MKLFIDSFAGGGGAADPNLSGSGLSRRLHLCGEGGTVDHEVADVAVFNPDDHGVVGYRRVRERLKLDAAAVQIATNKAEVTVQGDLKDRASEITPYKCDVSQDAREKDMGEVAAFHGHFLQDDALDSIQTGVCRVESRRPWAPDFPSDESNIVHRFDVGCRYIPCSERKRLRNGARCQHCQSGRLHMPLVGSQHFGTLVKAFRESTFFSQSASSISIPRSLIKQPSANDGNRKCQSVLQNGVALGVHGEKTGVIALHNKLHAEQSDQQNQPQQQYGNLARFPFVLRTSQCHPIPRAINHAKLRQTEHLVNAGVMMTACDRSGLPEGHVYGNGEIRHA